MSWGSTCLDRFESVPLGGMSGLAFARWGLAAEVLAENIGAPDWSWYTAHAGGSTNIYCTRKLHGYT